MNKFLLKITCPDARGLVAAITRVIAEKKANILHLTQHTACDMNVFMFKSVFDTEASFDPEDFRKSFSPVAQRFNMNWEVYNMAVKERVAILVSKTSHCLWEILLKHEDGELDCDLAAVISNHNTNREIAEAFKIPFFHVDYSRGKQKAEARMQGILDDYSVGLIVMARFMQILSPGFTEKWSEKVINIHHGFLPAFQGARPYHQAWFKGVKIIGATAHFANEELDQGPIIAQEVIKVDDTYSIQDMIKKGKDIERRTLIHALSLYLDHSIFLSGNRTFII